MRQKRIFTFWEPKDNLPGYLQLCMDTWRKFLPEYEVVVVDYSSLEKWIGKGCFDATLYSDFALSKQADAISCALLRRHGGIWLDCDTVITSEKVRGYLSSTSRFSQIGLHHAFMVADAESPILKRWYQLIVRNIRFSREYKAAKSGLAFWWLRLKYGTQYRDLVTHLNSWDYLVNFPLDSAIRPYWRRSRKGDFREYMSYDRTQGRLLPEIKPGVAEGPENYRRYYFETNCPEDALDGNGGIILLHNSWTPERYRMMTRGEFLSEQNTLSGVFKRVLNIV